MSGEIDAMALNEIKALLAKWDRTALKLDQASVERSVFAELFRSFASRSETKNFFQLGIFSNVYHLVAVGIPIVFQIFLLEVDTFGRFFKIQTISWTDDFLLLALTLVPTTILEIRKWSKTKK